MSAESALHEALTHSIKERLTFAAFRAPGGQVTLWAQQTPFVDHVENGLWWEMNDVFLFSPFRNEPRTPLIRSDVELTFGDAEPAWHRLLECTGSSETKLMSAPRATARNTFEKAIEEARAACASGVFEKIVLSRTIPLPVTPADAPHLFIEAARTRTEAFVALVNSPEHGLWLGASPERLIIAENDTVHIDALAGTMPLAEAPEEAAQWGAKERHEQQVVTKSITGSLIDLGARTILVEGPEVLRTANLAHLCTRIAATVEGRTVEDLVNAVHPTPAVCGVPVALTKEHIARLEDRDRELYAGYWGPWSADGRIELFVNIRCMRLFPDAAALYVGAGITAGSTPEKEWEETEHKARAWRDLLATTPRTLS